MATPKTKGEALQQMRLMWFAFLATIALYIYGGTITSFSFLNFRNEGIVFSVLGILDLLSFIRVRMHLYPRALKALQERPEDVRTVKRWNTLWTALLCIAETEAVFGVCVQMAHHKVQPALPFYGLAFLLILFLWPRQIRSQDIPATRS